MWTNAVHKSAPELWTYAVHRSEQELWTNAGHNFARLRSCRRREDLYREPFIAACIYLNGARDPEEHRNPWRVRLQQVRERGASHPPGPKENPRRGPSPPSSPPPTPCDNARLGAFRTRPWYFRPWIHCKDTQSRMIRWWFRPLSDTGLMSLKSEWV